MKWIVDGAGNKGIALGPDGTLYVGSESFVTAVGPDGRIRWRFVQNPRALIMLDPAVGPDGNIYAVGTEGQGIFSLTPAGTLRWAIPEQYDRPIIDHQEILIGKAGRRHQLYFHANRHFVGVRLSGSVRFDIPDATGQGGAQPAVAPDGTIYTNLSSIGLGAFNPDGTRKWVFPGRGEGTPDVAPDGIVYLNDSIKTLKAITPTGSLRWEYWDEGLLYFGPVVDPQNRLVVMGGPMPTSPYYGMVVAVDRAGAFLWRVLLPKENGGSIVPSVRARYSPAGEVAYVGTGIGGGDPKNEYCYLYAIRATP